MASEAVPKVLLKIGDMAVAQAFKAFSRLDVEVANIFDIESAAKFFDFAECGQSVFTSAGKKIQRLVAKYGLPGIPAAGKVFKFVISDAAFILFVRLNGTTSLSFTLHQSCPRPS